MGGSAYLSDWATHAHLPAVAAIVCITAVAILAVPAIFRYLRRRREDRRHMVPPSRRGEQPAAPPAMAARTARIADAANVKQDRLGWSNEGEAGGAADSQNESGAQRGAVLGREKTILIADDDPVIVQALSLRLRQMGFTVLRSPDAAHALMGTMKVKPELVILDINMPSGNGLAVCEMMASDPQYASIPVIIHSGSADEATKQRCRQLGAHHVEKSPRSWTEIKALVETLLGKKGTAKPRSPDVEAPHSADSRSPPPASPPACVEPPRGETPAPARAPVPSDAASASRSAVCGCPRVLCIEDPQGRLELIDHQLSALGIEVIRKSDLEEGFWTCFTEKPHVIIIQVAEAGKPLLDLLQRLNAHPVTRATPVLLVNEGNRIASDALPAAANRKVLKCPIDREELLSELETHLPAFGRSEVDPLASVAHADSEDGRHPRQNTPASGPSSEAEVPSAKAEVEEEPLKILCIDDDPIVARSIAVRLQPYGIQVRAATNGTQGYLMAAAQQPDLILLDLKMPNGEGNYVLGKLKTNERLKRVPVIVLTVETNPGVRRQMLSMGADAFVTKPARWPELFAEMGRCIDLPLSLMADYKLAEAQTLVAARPGR